jgi:hypothetical protein
MLFFIAFLPCLCCTWFVLILGGVFLLLFSPLRAACGGRQLPGCGPQDPGACADGGAGQGRRQAHQGDLRRRDPSSGLRPPVCRGRGRNLWTRYSHHPGGRRCTQSHLVNLVNQRLHHHAICVFLTCATSDTNYDCTEKQNLVLTELRICTPLLQVQQLMPTVILNN